MLKHSKILLVIFLVLSQSSVFSHEKKIIEIVGIQNYFPYTYMEKDSPTGFYNELLKELFKRAGYKLKISLVPFLRIIELMKNGRVAAMVGTFHTPLRAEYSEYLMDYPLVEISTSLFLRKDTNILSNEIPKLTKLHIASIRGFIMSKKYDKAETSGILKIHRVEDVNQLVRMTLLQRVDGFVYDTFASACDLKKLDKKGEIRKINPPIQAGRKSYLAFSRKYLKLLPKTFLKKIKKSLKSMVKDGTIKKMKQLFLNNC